MPFDIAPQIEAPFKVDFLFSLPTKPTPTGLYKHFAQALLVGAAVTEPLQGALHERRWAVAKFFGLRDKACALGAIGVGMGIDSDMRLANVTEKLRSAYIARYYTPIDMDNDSERFSREQIAARIAAL